MIESIHLLKTNRESNQDFKFDQKDEAIWYKAEWNNQEWKLTEIIDSTGRKKIEKLFFDQWLKREDGN